MDTQFEDHFLEILQKNITPLILTTHTQLSVYKNNLLNKVEIKFSQSNNSFIVVVFEFRNKQMLVKLGDMSDGDIGIVEFKNFFDGVFNVINMSYANLFQIYRLSKHW